MTSGQPKGERASSQPESRGLSAEARLLGTAVTLAAAGRSAAETTAITYELRTGTSICDSALRSNRQATASSTVGMKGVSTRKRLAGRWVKTAVLRRPMRPAMRTAASAEKADRVPVQKKMAPTVATETSKRWNNQSASRDWTTSPLPKESRLKSAASLMTIPLEVVSGAAAVFTSGSIAGDRPR